MFEMKEETQKRDDLEFERLKKQGRFKSQYEYLERMKAEKNGNK